MQYTISFLEGVTAFLTSGLLAMLPVYMVWCLGGGLRNNAQALKTAFGFGLGFAAAVLAAGWAGLTVSTPVCGGVLLLLGLLRITALEGKLPNPLPGILCGMAVALRWTGFQGFFPDTLTAEGSLLLVCYALGTMVPILFIGVFLERLKAEISWIQNHLRETERISGILLLAAGIMILF